MVISYQLSAFSNQPETGPEVVLAISRQPTVISQAIETNRKTAGSMQLAEKLLLTTHNNPLVTLSSVFTAYYP